MQVTLIISKGNIQCLIQKLLHLPLSLSQECRHLCPFLFCQNDVMNNPDHKPNYVYLPLEKPTDHSNILLQLLH